MRTERIQAELGLVHARHGAVETDATLSWMMLPAWPLPSGWNRSATPLIVPLPAAYPSTPPDNFYTSADLRTAANAAPGNTSTVNGQPGLPAGSWLMFSWHIEANWHAGADPQAGDNLLTFLDSVSQRLSEVG